jgi:hypothetical protein
MKADNLAAFSKKEALYLFESWRSMLIKKDYRTNLSNQLLKINLGRWMPKWPPKTSIRFLVIERVQNSNMLDSLLINYVSRSRDILSGNHRGKKQYLGDNGFTVNKSSSSSANQPAASE